jgi:hypothetical protein
MRQAPPLGQSISNTTIPFRGMPIIIGNLGGVALGAVAADGVLGCVCAVPPGVPTLEAPQEQY